MHYALLFHQSPEEFAAREDPQKRAAFWGSFVPYMKALQEAGIVVAGAGLQPPATAVSVRPGASGHQVQDGPFADTKEQLGGFFIIDVPDMDTALKWAARYPAGTHGGVEVRPTLPPTTHAEMLKSLETTNG
ncbi:MAG TPA: YciI family protein [Rhizobiaceae bacterium]|nr:YciI family protein [Rhizobiaceae bacterium]